MDNEQGETGASERRGYFRVEDVLPVMLKKIDYSPSEVMPKILAVNSYASKTAPPPDSFQDSGIGPQIWEMLLDLRSKLDHILEKLTLQEEGLTRAESRRVSLSASGLRVRTTDIFGLGDYLEMKIFLTLASPVWITLYGEIIRIESCRSGLWEIAIQFAEMGDPIFDLLSNYALKRQRESIRRRQVLDASS